MPGFTPWAFATEQQCHCTYTTRDEECWECSSAVVKVKMSEPWQCRSCSVLAMSAALLTAGHRAQTEIHMESFRLHMNGNLLLWPRHGGASPDDESPASASALAMPWSMLPVLHGHICGEHMAMHCLKLHSTSHQLNTWLCTAGSIPQSIATVDVDRVASRQGFMLHWFTHFPSRPEAAQQLLMFVK